MMTMAEAAAPEAVRSKRALPREETKPKKQPAYHVVLLDDDDHTYEYVIGMIRRLFGYSAEMSFQLAEEVDSTGRVIVDTTTMERAEFKRDQIATFGRDWRLPRCAGSMSAIIEPAAE